MWIQNRENNKKTNIASHRMRKQFEFMCISFAMHIRLERRKELKWKSKQHLMHYVYSIWVVQTKLSKQAILWSFYSFWPLELFVKIFFLVSIIENLLIFCTTTQTLYIKAICYVISLISFVCVHCARKWKSHKNERRIPNIFRCHYARIRKYIVQEWGRENRLSVLRKI